MEDEFIDSDSLVSTESTKVDLAEQKSSLIKIKNDWLCQYCKRTSSNGIRCIGRCVADSEY